MAKHPAKCPKCGGRLDYESAVDGLLACPGCGARLRAPAREPDLASSKAATLTPPSPRSAPADPLLGQRLGEFEIIALLGRGGMGAVYKARQTSLDRFVAIKVLPQQYADDLAFLERFNREARAAAAIGHPNIVQVIVVGQDKGHEFIAMELVDGENLSDVLKREGRLAPDVALAYLKQVTSALGKAHAAGVVHRDIKPANILLTSDGQVKVADFGLAKRTGVDVSVTATGASLGTPLYMPPEVAEAKPCDARSDLYSLGATFYHLLAGRPPFEGSTAAELILKHYRAEVQPLGEAAPDAPPALCAVIRRLLRKAPAERFQSAAELLDALDRVVIRVAQPPAAVREQRRAAVPHRQRPVSLPRETARGPETARLQSRPEDATPTLVLRPTVGGASVPRVRFALIAGAAIVLVVILILILRSGPSSQSAIRTPKSAIPPSPTPATQHPTPGVEAAAERNAALCLQYARTCADRKDWLKAEGYLDQLASKYAATRFAADNKSAIAALRAQVAATPKGTPEPTPAAEWTTLPNGWRVGKPVNLGPVVNSQSSDGEPSVSADGLTLLFASTRPGGQGGFDQWTCKRRSTAEAWEPPVNLGPTVNSSADEGGPCLSADNLTLLFTSTRPGGQGGCDLWMCTRSSPGEQWGKPANLGPTVNSTGHDVVPTLSADGLVLVLASDRPGGQGSFDLWMCTRNTPGDPWTSPVNLGPAVNSSGEDRGRGLTGDGLTLSFHSNRPGGQGGCDLWMSTRRNRTEPFGEPVNLGTGINSKFGEVTPGISSDGRTLYFASDRPGGQGGYDLYQAPLLPPGAPLPAPPDDDARWGPWEDLFDGKSLAGWKVVTFSAQPRGDPVEVQNGQVCVNTLSGRAGIGWTGDIPSMGYELEYESKRVEGQRSLGSIVFPVGKTTCGVVVGEWEGVVVAFEMVDGHGGRDNVTTTRFAFENERWYRVRLRVTEGRLALFVDGKPVIDFATAGHQLAVAGQMADSGPLGLSTFYARVAIRSIRLRRLKPEGAEAPKAGAWKVYGDWPFDEKEAKRRQEETAKALGVPTEQDVDLGNGVKMSFVLIPAGEFLMGSPPTTSPEKLAAAYGGDPKEYESEFPQHRVKISRPFWLGKTEVTQEQWQAVMGDNPSNYKGRPQNPVEKVNWLNCQGFVQKLSARPKKTFRLPTEAEWEYACRAGTGTEFFFGDAVANLGTYAWFNGNAGGITQPVGRTKPNAWGLHDMAGNVWEWCEDWLAPYDKEPQKDPKGPGSGAVRVLRGGSWYNNPAFCRSANRYSIDPWYEIIYGRVGCRVVLRDF